jgi:S1-C subfamily serine protease
MRMIMKISAIGLAVGLCLPLLAASKNHSGMKGTAMDDRSSRSGTASTTSPSGELALSSSKRGVVVDRAEDGASVLGLQRDDVVRSIDGKAIQTPEDLMAVIRDGEPASRYSLTVVRKGEEMSVAAERAAWRSFLTPRPPEPPMAGAEHPAPPVPPSTN